MDYFIITVLGIGFILFLLMMVVSVCEIFAKDSLKYTDLHNGQMLVELEKGSTKFMFDEIKNKYGDKYKVVATNSNRYGHIVSVIVEVGK